MARVIIDERAGQHLTDRIKTRIKGETGQRRIVEIIKRMLTMQAPAEVEREGHYDWHINVEQIGRIVCRGNMIRSVYSMEERYPGGTEFKIIANGFTRV